jgi:hypothetical protein
MIFFFTILDDDLSLFRLNIKLISQLYKFKINEKKSSNFLLHSRSGYL